MKNHRKPKLGLVEFEQLYNEIFKESMLAFKGAPQYISPARLIELEKDTYRSLRQSKKWMGRCLSSKFWRWYVWKFKRRYILAEIWELFYPQEIEKTPEPIKEPQPTPPTKEPEVLNAPPPQALLENRTEKHDDKHDVGSEELDSS